MLPTTRIALLHRAQVIKFRFLSSGWSNYGANALNGYSDGTAFVAPTLTQSYEPAYSSIISDPDDWLTFHARLDTIAAIKNGKPLTAGKNQNGQLARVSTTAVDGNQHHRLDYVNVQVPGAPVGTYKTDFVDIGVGHAHIAALDAAGDVWTAGDDNTSAQCGRGFRGMGADANVLVMYNTIATPEPRRPAGLKFEAIKVGHRFTMARTVGGMHIYNFGNNGGDNQLGRKAMMIGNTRPINTPVFAAYPALVAGSVVQASDPDYVADGTQDLNWREPVIFDASGNLVTGPWGFMLAGGYHAAVQHLATQKLYAWGAFSLGERGEDAIAFAASPQGNGHQNEPREIPMIDGIPWVDGSMGEHGTFLINAIGDMYYSGEGYAGQHGLGHNNNVLVLTKVPGKWKSVSCDYGHSAGVKIDGTLWTCGNAALGRSTSTVPANTWGQVGTDTDWAYAVTTQYTATAIKRVVS